MDKFVYFSVRPDSLRMLLEAVEWEQDSVRLQTTNKY